MERAIKRMSSANDIENLMPQDLINAKPAAASLREFLVQVNYLNLWIRQIHYLKSLIKEECQHWVHGGLTRERAGFEVRDVHPTRYGRICPIETPEVQILD